MVITINMGKYFTSVAPCDQSRTEKVSLGSLEGFHLGIGFCIFHDMFVHNWYGLEFETLGLGKGTVLCCASLWWWGQRSDECFFGGVPGSCSSGSSAATKGRPKVPRFSIAL